MDLQVKLSNELELYQRLYALNERDQVISKKTGERIAVRKHDGYLYVSLKLYHRIVFGLVNNWLPEKVDHADRDTMNNKPDNLRECTGLQSVLNRGVHKNNELGLKGVCRNSGSKTRPFRAYFKGYTISCKTLTDALDMHDAMILSHDKTFAVTHMSGLKKAFFVDWLYHHPDGKELRAEILAETGKHRQPAA